MVPRHRFVVNHDLIHAMTPDFPAGLFDIVKIGLLALNRPDNQFTSLAAPGTPIMHPLMLAHELLLLHQVLIPVLTMRQTRTQLDQNFQNPKPKTPNLKIHIQIFGTAKKKLNSNLRKAKDYTCWIYDDGKCWYYHKQNYFPYPLLQYDSQSKPYLS